MTATGMDYSPGRRKTATLGTKTERLQRFGTGLFVVSC